MDAAVEQDRGVLMIADSDRLRPREPGERDLARRRLPRRRMCLAPAKGSPARFRIDRRSAIVADWGRRKHRRRRQALRSPHRSAADTGPRFTRQSALRLSAPALRLAYRKIVDGSPVNPKPGGRKRRRERSRRQRADYRAVLLPVCIRFCALVSAFARKIRSVSCCCCGGIALYRFPNAGTSFPRSSAWASAICWYDCMF